ncbi:MAG TPA: potassium channel family protein [Candidatus Nanoarchaeia archaeon]|nr:potassium channel family protein [Candidatus Nanoarchaeia archaeon]
MKKDELVKMSQEEHQAYHRRIIYVFIILMIVLFGGATFYHYAENWTYLDSVYFSASTITTVGYGDFHPVTDIGKFFTIIYLFTGVGVALYSLSLMASHFVEVREEFWLERLEKTMIRQHTGTVWSKIKNAFNYKPGSLVKEYENSVKRKR